MTIDGIPINIEGIGVVGLVILFALALARGWLFTKRQYDDTVHDRDQWRTESRLKDQQLVELSEQNRAMLQAFGPTLTDFLQGLRRAGVGGPRDGDER